MSDAKDSDEESFRLYCSFCLHARTGVAEEAVTVINGHAVCYDHMGYAQGGNWTLKLAAVIEYENTAR